MSAPHPDAHPSAHSGPGAPQAQIGIVMLCHTALDRAAQVARFWAQAGCPVVIHLDRRLGETDRGALARRLADLPGVSFSRRFRGDWGTWSLVAASQAACQQMLARHPTVSHVYLCSGACLPLRPVADLAAYLDRHPGRDFIESVTTAEVGWAQGGLTDERFSLRHPFRWKSQRWLFDRSVALQRRLRLWRAPPLGLVPHLGSQWWCLTRATLSAILNDPERPRIDAWFRRVWIPDESYFQTLVRRHGARVESRSLTLSRFDLDGRPHVFYDDHLQLLRRSDCFVARKIWPRAERLYQAFLARPPAPTADQAASPARADKPHPGKIERLFSRAVDQRRFGRPGLYMQSRFPRRDHENGKTAAPYSLFQGFAELYCDFDLWLSRASGIGRVHGHLFAPDRVEFAGGATVYHGGLCDSARLRDYDPRAFLTNLIRATRGERQCFQFGPADNQALNWFWATDPQAQISVITGAWALPLYHRYRAGAGSVPFAALRAEAARLQRHEVEQIAILRSVYVKARVRIWSLADFLDGPLDALQDIIDEIAPRAPRRLTEAPALRDLTGFGAFLQALKNQGMKPLLMGDFPDDDLPWPQARGTAQTLLMK